MNWLSNKLFYTIGITLLCGGLHAQSLAEAKKLYNEGKYAEAKPAFEKLVNKRQTIPPIIIGMVSAATRPVI